MGRRPDSKHTVVQTIRYDNRPDHGKNGNPEDSS